VGRTNNNLAVYMKYDALTVDALGEFLSGLGDIVEYLRVNSTETDPNLVPDLVISAMHTGSSIKFTVRSRRRVHIDRDGQVVVAVRTKGVQSALVVGQLLVEGAAIVFGVIAGAGMIMPHPTGPETIGTRASVLSNPLHREHLDKMGAHIVERAIDNGFTSLVINGYDLIPHPSEEQASTPAPKTER